jgi:hypothetical protein
MIILLGKHQFTVSSVDDAPSAHQSFLAAGSGSGKNAGLRKSGLNSETILSLVESAERLLSDFSTDPNSAASKNELSARYAKLADMPTL